MDKEIEDKVARKREALVDTVVYTKQQDSDVDTNNK